MMELEIDHARLDEQWVKLAVKGEIDLSTVHKLEDAVEQAFNQDGVHVLIDLTAVTFMDSTGLRFLLTSDRRFRGSGRSLALVVVEGPVSRLLEISGADKSLDIVSDPGEIMSPYDG